VENSTRIATLVYKYIRKDLTVEETAELQAWVYQSDKNRIFFEETIQPGHLFDEAQNRDEEDRHINLDEAWQKLLAMGIPAEVPIRARGGKVTPMRRRWLVAAALVLAVTMGALYLLLQKQPVHEPAVTVKKIKEVNDVSPATRPATLTLTNGQVVSLDSANSGLLAIEGSARVIKKQDGQIVYDIVNGYGPDLYNTITVPRGSDVVHITLGDGTKVWLNAASSLHYPVVFTGGERKVEINGEAYFEVAHDEAAPFKVMKGHLEIGVLGTHFNVNAYPGEDAIKVTLLEGKVKVTTSVPIGIETAIDNKQYAVLKPGQQAVVHNENAITVNSAIDQEAVMAWKNGLFYFDNASLGLVVRQIERWYDVSIQYDSSLKETGLNGQISRYSNISKVLDLLQSAEAFRYKIKDRKIYITPFEK
jgi:transmembrane sensor